MGKDNGIIRDGVKGGNWARVINGALQVRAVAGGGSSISFPITPAQGGTGTTTVFTQGSVVFVGPAGVYAQDNANLFWDDTNKLLTASLVVLGKQATNYGALGLAGSIAGAAYNFASGSSDKNLYINVPSGFQYRFQINDSEVARVTAGRWLLGTTTDDGSSRLQVSGNVAVTGKVTSVGSGGDYIELDSSTNTITIFDNGVESGTIGVAGSVFTFNRSIRLTSLANGSRVALLDANKSIISGPATAVTGSRALPEQALKDLLTKLADIGVITDSTTV